MIRSKHPETKGDIDLRGYMTMKRTYFLMSCVTIVVAVAHPSLFYRIVFALFGVAFGIAGEKIKDIEKAKTKERDLTEIREQKKRLEGWASSLQGQEDFLREQNAKAMGAALAQVSTYVKDASPTRAAELHIMNEDEK